MPICKSGHYKSNIILSRSPLVCLGGYGQKPCEYLEQCRKSLWSDYQDWGRKNNFKHTKKNFSNYFVEKMIEGVAEWSQ
jgi:hypothetical protein